MIIKCKKYISSGSKKELNESCWITQNKEYVVLSLTICRIQGVSAWIKTDDNIMGFPDLDGFEVVSQYIPSNWKPSIDSLGRYSLEPKRWEGDFYDNFYNGDPETWDIFVEEATIIYNEHGLSFPPTGYYSQESYDIRPNK